MVRYVLIAALAALGSCYSPSPRSCQVTCGPEDRCPDGSMCREDGFCHADDAEVCAASFASLAAGHYHTCGIEAGALWCWGSNTHGQLGNGETLPASVVTRIGDASDWTHVSPSSQHTCGIRAPGTLWCWGNGERHRLGLGSEEPVPTPTQVGDADDWIAVESGTTHTCGLRAPGTLWCWGDDEVDAIVQTPTKIGTAEDWTAISAAWNYQCGLRGAGDLYCWGKGEFWAPGRIGTGDNGTKTTPVRIGSELWSQISAMEGHTCAIRSDSQLWCWGVNGAGQLGTGAPDGTDEPVQVGTDEDWASVAAGGAHTCARRADGSLWCWGQNGDGRVGDGTTVVRRTPVLVEAETAWGSVSTGNAHTCGVRTDGSTWCWGGNDVGQLGRGTVASEQTPTRVGTDTDWTEVDVGISHSCALRDTGAAWCWGANHAGQLGDGTTQQAQSPAEVDGAHAWARLDGGLAHTCAINRGGAMWCWGDNISGQLGDDDSGPTANKSSPVRVGNAVGWTAVATGSRDTLALRTDQSMQQWGSGQRTPVQLDLGPWKSVAISQDGVWGNRACAVRDDGRASCWIIGEGFTDANADTDWAQISVGSCLQCGLKSTNALWCWGCFTGHAAPTSMGGNDWLSVSMGSYHGCGIRAGNTLWCWGANAAGQLGDGTATNREAPVQIGAETDWIDVSAGGAHTCGVRGDGSLWCWGGSTNGQLGIGVSGALAPAPVSRP